MGTMILRGSLLGLTLALTCTTAVNAADDGKTYDLKSRRKAGQIDHVEATLEAGGELIFADETHEKAKISVVAKLDYDERLMELADGIPSGSLRYYNKAQAAIKGVDDGVKATLRDSLRLIVASTNGQQATLFSPNGPLTRDELDLVDMLGNSLLLDRLLPAKPVALNASWESDSDLMAALFGLELVTNNTVKSTLTSVKGNSAIVELAGRVEGSVGGGRSVLEMKAKYRYDFRTHRINWCGLAVHERRQPGHALQGFDLVARLQVQILPKEKSDQLADAAVKDISLDPTAASTQLVYQPPSKEWQFTYDRRWFVTVDEHDRAVLRLVDAGDLVANCSVSGLAKLAEGKEVSLPHFQEDIKRALGENFGQFLRASQWAGPTKLRIYRVAVAGTIKTGLKGDSTDVPIEWHYFRVADEPGHQVVFAFTVEKPLVERLGEDDKRLVESLRFKDPAVAAKPKGDKANEKERK